MPAAPELDKRTLSEALADIERRLSMGRGFGLTAKQPPMGRVLAAARFAFPLLPEKCGTCGGYGGVRDYEIVAEPGHAPGCGGETCNTTCPVPVPTQVEVMNACPSCHGSGLVWDPETVERIEQAIIDAAPDSQASEIVYAVLAALNSPTPEAAK